MTVSLSDGNTCHVRPKLLLLEGIGPFANLVHCVYVYMFRIPSGWNVPCPSTSGYGNMAGTSLVEGFGGPTVRTSNSKTPLQLLKPCTSQQNWHTCFPMNLVT